MKKETRFLLSGILAGLVAGVTAAFTIDYWLAHVARTSASLPVVHSSRTPAESAGGSPGEVGQRSQPAEDLTNLAGSAVEPADAAVVIQVTPTHSITFSAPFVNAMRELKAAGESPDLVVNLVRFSYTRQWMDLTKEIRGKEGDPTFNEDEAREMMSRENVFHESVAAIIGEDSFTAYDKQRVLKMRLGPAGYSLTEAESNELYRIEKEHEQRNAELTRATSAGEIDPFDAAQQRQKLEEAYQQDRARLVPDRAEAPSMGVGRQDNVSAIVKQQTQGLNLTPQQLADLTEVTQRKLLAYRELQQSAMSATNDIAREQVIAKEQELDAAAERDWERILGSEGYADYKKANDYRYQQMKRYQQHWQLSDGDINNLYQTYMRHEKAVEQFTSQFPPTSQGGDAKPDPEVTARVEAFAKDDNKGLQTELLQLLGEDRYKRFQAAGLAPRDDE